MTMAKTIMSPKSRTLLDSVVIASRSQHQSAPIGQVIDFENLDPQFSSLAKKFKISNGGMNHSH
jgi:hypothetical protein